MKKKALPIAEVLYSGYLLLFLFDNITSYNIYLINAFQVKNISKKFNSKQVFLRDSQYFQERLQVTQKIYIDNLNETQYQKKYLKSLKKFFFQLIKKISLPKF